MSRKAPPWAGSGRGDKANDEVLGRIHRAFYFGRERTPIQDIEYAIDQLVEVAVRALSPGTNDPFTAMTCIEWLGASLIRVAGREIPSGWRYDEQDQLRIVTKATDFAGMAAAAFNQIRQYGSESVAVVLRLLEALEKVGPHLRRESDREVLREHARKIRDDGVAHVQNELDRAEIEERFAVAEQALAKTT